MSSDSTGPKNDPLFERLFAEAEACLDRSKKPASGNEANPDRGGGELAPRSEPQSESENSETVKTTEAQPKRSMTLSGGQLPLQSSRLGARMRSQGMRSSQGDGGALALAEAKVNKLQERLGTIKDRSKRDQEMALSKQKDKMIVQFLGLLDDLERALSSDVDTHTDNPQFASYKQGIQQVYDGGLQLLSQFGVSRFESAGQLFDPNLHEAVRREPRADMEPNLVVEVFQAGYLIDERLLRAARVSVSASTN